MNPDTRLQSEGLSGVGHGRAPYSPSPCTPQPVSRTLVPANRAPHPDSCTLLSAPLQPNPCTAARFAHGDGLSPATQRWCRPSHGLTASPYTVHVKGIRCRIECFYFLKRYDNYRQHEAPDRNPCPFPLGSPTSIRCRPKRPDVDHN